MCSERESDAPLVKSVAMGCHVADLPRAVNEALPRHRACAVNRDVTLTDKTA